MLARSYRNPLLRVRPHSSADRRSDGMVPRQSHQSAGRGARAGHRQGHSAQRRAAVHGGGAEAARALRPRDRAGRASGSNVGGLRQPGAAGRGMCERECGPGHAGSRRPLGDAGGDRPRHFASRAARHDLRAAPGNEPGAGDAADAEQHRPRVLVGVQGQRLRPSGARHRLVAGDARGLGARRRGRESLRDRSAVRHRAGGCGRHHREQLDPSRRQHERVRRRRPQVGGRRRRCQRPLLRH